MRYLVIPSILALLSGCASYQAQFNEKLGTLVGASESELVQSWGAPFEAGTLENGMQYARYAFVNENNEQARCNVDVLFEQDAAVHALWGGACRWDADVQKPYASTLSAEGYSINNSVYLSRARMENVRPAYMLPAPKPFRPKNN